MILSLRRLCLIACILWCAACHRSSAPSAVAPPLVAPPPAAAPATANGRLNQLVERYWDDYLALNPSEATANGEHRFDAHLENSASLQYLADSLALERRALSGLAAIPAQQLDIQSKLSFDMFKLARESAIERYAFPDELMPVNQIDGMALRFAQLGSGSAGQHFKSHEDYLNWLSRIADFASWKTSAIADMRDGVRRGYTLPSVLVRATLPQLAALADDRDDNPFYAPLHTFPAVMTATERDDLTRRLTAALKDTVLPAYRELHDYLAKQYLPAARASDGLAALPMGEAWYAARIRHETSTSLSAVQIHALGLSEVARLHARLQTMISQVGFTGDGKAFLEFLGHDPRFHCASAEELLAGYRALKPMVLVATPKLFAIVPDADFEIEPVEPFRQSAAGAADYQTATGRGGSTGVLYVNTSDWERRPKFAMVGLFLRDAVPGHLYQNALQEERRDLPRFRRFGRAAAFDRGWALYAENLGDDLGLFTDPYSTIGALLSEIRAAATLVADSGLHAKGWSRQRGIDYLRAEVGLSAQEAGAEIERAMALPGAALAETLGELDIKAIRLRAEQALGPRFDIRAFHDEMLKDGAMPLGLLDAKMDRWIESVH